MAEKSLIERIGTLESRGILMNSFFGRQYFKDNNWYIRRNIFSDGTWANIITELGSWSLRDPEAIITRAAHWLGKEPLTSREICLDMMAAMKNLGLEDHLKYVINADNPDLTPEKIEENAKEIAYAGNTRGETTLGYSLGKSLGEYVKNLSAIRLKKEDTAVFVIEHTHIEKEIGILPKIPEFCGISTQDFLNAYIPTIEPHCVSNYELELKKFRSQSLTK